MTKKKVLVSLSGGMDSTTVLAAALDAGFDVKAVFFHYGSKHNSFERIAVRDLADHYGMWVRHVDMTEIGFLLKSDLLMSGGAIPEGHYEADTMRQTVVPGRNIIFCSVLAGMAWSLGCEEVWLGIHAGDHFIYPDCRPEFFEAMNRAVQLGTDFKVELKAPFLNVNKAEVLKKGLLLQIPYVLTRTCYKYQSMACGKCGSCQERLESFKINGKMDPIEYESRELVAKS